MQSQLNISPDCDSPECPNPRSEENYLLSLQCPHNMCICCAKDKLESNGKKDILKHLCPLCGKESLMDLNDITKNIDFFKKQMQDESYKQILPPPIIVCTDHA